MNIKIKTNKRERNIGIYYPAPTNVFYKEVSKSRHLFKALNAWGIDAKIFNEVLLPNNAKIQIYEKERRIDYRLTAKEFKKYSIHLHFKTNEDNQAQIFCPLRRFDITDRMY